MVLPVGLPSVGRDSRGMPHVSTLSTIFGWSSTQISTARHWLVSLIAISSSSDCRARLNQQTHKHTNRHPISALHGSQAFLPPTHSALPLWPIPCAAARLACCRRVDRRHSESTVDSDCFRCGPNRIGAFRPPALQLRYSVALSTMHPASHLAHCSGHAALHDVEHCAALQRHQLQRYSLAACDYLRWLYIVFSAYRMSRMNVSCTRQ